MSAGCVRDHSVRDWLTDPERSGPYWIDVSAQEQRLSNLAWREYQDGVNTMGRYCIIYAPSHFVAGQRRMELKTLLLDPEWIKAKIQIVGVVPVLADYGQALDVLSPKLRIEADLTDDPLTSALEMVQRALSLSSHVIAKDPEQFASQMVGRLASRDDRVEIRKF